MDALFSTSPKKGGGGEKGDVYVQLLSDDGASEMEEGMGGGTQNRENEFITDLYDVVLLSSNKERDTGICREDFLFEMFHRSVGGRIFWWMSPNHPLAIMMHDNGYPPYDASTQGFGNASVFSDDVVQTCLDSLVDMCKRNALRINQE